MEQAKALDKMKAIEDQMLIDAALEEEFGDAAGSGPVVVTEASASRVWDWLADVEDQSKSTGADLEDAQQVGRRMLFLSG